ncbi:hypothetical protein DRW03_12320 [Corallococcus sp. H22C18031201]|nr:hypothetical protein DRW03_12320 [Corallococcus sp. H22C18031201]
MSIVEGMRAIDTQDERIATLLVADDRDLPRDGSTDVQVRLRDGRRFIVTLHTLEALARRLDEAPAFVASGVLLVKRMTDAAVVSAVRAALGEGLERYGALQPPIEE